VRGWIQPTSLVMIISPVWSLSMPPTGTMRSSELRGTKFSTVSRAMSSTIVVSTDLGLLTATQKVFFTSGMDTFFPSTTTASRRGFTLVPTSVTSFPFTDTRPSKIKVSAALLDAIPALAMTFCRRSSVANTAKSGTVASSAASSFFRDKYNGELSVLCVRRRPIYDVLRSA